MKRLALAAALVLPLALGARAAVRTGHASPAATSCPYAARSAGESRCPYLAASAPVTGEGGSQDGARCPARPFASGRCPVTGAAHRTGTCPRGGAAPASPHPFLRAAGGGVV